MISESARKLSMMYNNQVQTPDAGNLLAIWLTEDLESLRTQRNELDARIIRAEQRLGTLRDGSTFATASVEPAVQPAPSRTVLTAGDNAQGDSSGAPSDGPPRRSIMSLKLETRTHNAITNAGVISFAQLVRMTPKELRALPGFGAGCLTDLEAALARAGVALPGATNNVLVAAATDADVVVAAETGGPTTVNTPTRAANNTANSLATKLGDETRRTADALSVESGILGQTTRATLTNTLNADSAQAETSSGFSTPEIVRQLSTSLALLQRAIDGRPISIMQDVALNVVDVSESDLAAATRYFGFDGATSETLDVIGEREGVTRERIRQRIARYRQHAGGRRPLLLVVREAVSVLQQLNKPVTLNEWCAALPSWMAGTRPDDLRIVQTLESFGWLDANSWNESGGIMFVMAGAGATAPMQSYQARYEDTIANHYRFGVVRAEDICKVLDITEAAAVGALTADVRWRAHNNGWFVRENLATSWIAKRIIEVLNGVRSIAIEPLYQALKRAAGHKFLEQGCVMPPRALLVKLAQELRTEGVRFDIVHEIVSVDAPVHDRELSGTAQAIIKAFDTHHRALTGAELTAKIQAEGLSDASAQLALSTSVLINRIERGIYGLVGRHADMRDVATARLRREAGRMVGSDG